MGASLWAPFPECAPVFQVFRGSDSVVKSLALSQVALHEQRAAYNVLLESTDLDRAEWERQKEELVSLQYLMAVLRRLNTTPATSVLLLSAGRAAETIDSAKCRG